MTIEIETEHYRCQKCGEIRNHPGEACPNCQAHTPFDIASRVYIRR